MVVITLRITREAASFPGSVEALHYFQNAVNDISASSSTVRSLLDELNTHAQKFGAFSATLVDEENMELADDKTDTKVAHLLIERSKERIH